MIPRKKRITILIVSIISVVVIMIILFILLYLNTDMFKSKKTLFIKYIMKNSENLENIVDLLEDKEYSKKLNESKYTSSTEIKLNYTENIGTSSENTSNSINKFSLSVNGKTDKSNNYNYQNVKILDNNKDEKLSVEYVRDNNIYGVRFSDLFNQYILVENSNLKNLYEKIDYDENELANIPDSINIKNDLLNNIKFTQEEKQILENKYKEIFEKQFENEKITKQSNQIIMINNEQIKTNAYTLTLTKEQMNDIYLKILETIKQDDIILTKLENINKIVTMTNQKNIKDYFIEEIDNTISEINKTNIGQDETKIIVYEKGKKTVRTTIKYTDYEINIDRNGTNDNQYAQLKLEKLNSIETKIITLLKEGNSLDIEISDNNEVEKKVKISKNTNINENSCTNNIIIKYENESNRIETNINQNINFVNELSNLQQLKEDNSIKLNDLEKENVQQVLKTVSTSLDEKINSTFDTQNIEDFYKILKLVGIMKEEQIIEVTGITETEKNRFNSQFEILQGNKLSGDNIINAIQSAQNNINDIEVISNTQLKIKIDRNNKNEEVTEQLIDFIEKNKTKKYDIKVEYDENGLVEYIVIDIVTE